jgi:hypothetical protein
MEDQDIFIKANKALMEGDYRDSLPTGARISNGKMSAEGPSTEKLNF